jgi:hypothetical protein
MYFEHFPPMIARSELMEAVHDIQRDGQQSLQKCHERSLTLCKYLVRHRDKLPAEVAAIVDEFQHEAQAGLAAAEKNLRKLRGGIVEHT